MSELDISERARRILESSNRVVFEEPIRYRELVDPITFIIMLPFLPLYIIYMVFTHGRRRLAVTEIERTPTGWRILEYER